MCVEVFNNRDECFLIRLRIINLKFSKKKLKIFVYLPDILEVCLVNMDYTAISGI